MTVLMDFNKERSPRVAPPAELALHSRIVGDRFSVSPRRSAGAFGLVLAHGPRFAGVSRSFKFAHVFQVGG